MPKVGRGFSLAIEYYREEDGRWLAGIPALPGVTAYGRSRRQATAAVQALALRLIADRLEHGEVVPGPMCCLPTTTVSPSAPRP
jgi:predicted RNase H-like HicB family nuclease